MNNWPCLEGPCACSGDLEASPKISTALQNRNRNHKRKQRHEIHIVCLVSRRELMREREHKCQKKTAKRAQQESSRRSKREQGRAPAFKKNTVKTEMKTFSLGTTRNVYNGKMTHWLVYGRTQSAAWKLAYQSN